MTDIEIAHSITKKPIHEIIKNNNISNSYVEYYGSDKAKISLKAINKDNILKNKLILVTATSPTPMGEGKTTTSIGLADGLNEINCSANLALREPSLGPVFGIKGGATGGGYSQVLPMEDINLHFTGDFHAISTANNLLAAMIDNHIFQGNELGINPERIIWKHCIDMNDRQLRYITSGEGSEKDGIPREDGFDITVASEIMAILCLSTSIDDLKERLGNIIIGYDFDESPVLAKYLHAEGAMTALLKDAIKPNLVQTLEGTPAFIHGGPFANIAHGCNSILATNMARSYAKYTVTEAGFGSDLGAEKFLDIKCRMNNIKPDAVVLVTTIRSIKAAGGISKEDIYNENVDAIKIGFENTKQHYFNITKEYGLPCVLAINLRDTDLASEIDFVKNLASDNNMLCEIAMPYQKGGSGCVDLAYRVVELCNIDSDIKYPYDLDDSVMKKIVKLCTKVYHAKNVEFTSDALDQIENIKNTPAENMPICVAKTQYSFSDDPKKVTITKNFTMHVRSIKVCNGAGFIVVYMGNILTMPGLPKHPAAENIDVDNNGNITGIF